MATAVRLTTVFVIIAVAISVGTTSADATQFRIQVAGVDSSTQLHVDLSSMGLYPDGPWPDLEASGIDYLTAGWADIVWTGIAPTEAQRAQLRSQGRGELLLIPINASHIGIGSTRRLGAAPITSAELCAATTSLVPQVPNFVVTAVPSRANLALSDFCLHREPAIWDSYRAAVAANATWATTASPEFLRGEASSTLPMTPGLTFAPSQVRASEMIEYDGWGLDSSKPRSWGLVDYGLHAGNWVDSRPLLDETGQQVPASLLGPLAASTERADGTFSTQSLPLSSGFPLVGIDYLAIRWSDDPQLRAEISSVVGALLDLADAPTPQGLTRLPHQLVELGRQRLAAMSGPTPAVPEFPVVPVVIPLAAGIVGLVWRRRSVVAAT